MNKLKWVLHCIDLVSDRVGQFFSFFLIAIVPIISLEGYREDTNGRRGKGVYERLQETIRLLRSKGIFFGTSLTVTSSNFATITDEQFIQNSASLGCKLFLFVEYTPTKEETGDWVITDEQRASLSSLMNSFRSRFSALFVGVPGDEKEFGGCLSAGRGFVHVSAEGNVEPCPFVPYSDTNLRDLSLREALQSEFLKAIRENQEQLGEGKGGCALWEKREWVRSLLITPGSSAQGDEYTITPANESKLELEPLPVR